MGMRYALVTGSSGFIGRHIAESLTAAGYTVYGIDTMHPRNDRVYHTLYDARDFFRRDDRHFDVAVHCAAEVGGRYTIDNAPLQQAINFELDAGLFRWAIRTRPSRVVYLSSSAVYPVAMQSFEQSLSEDAIQPVGKLKMFGVPDKLYGWTKLVGELQAALVRQQGIPVTVGRPFSGYGEDQDTSYPFAAFAERARAKVDPFVIWGNGSQVRDWIHVDDICSAIMRLIDQGIDGPVNLGTGRGTSMFDLARIFVEAVGYEPEFVFRTDMPSGVQYRVADTARMRGLYTPKISLEEGVRRAVHYAG